MSRNRLRACAAALAVAMPLALTSCSSSEAAGGSDTCPGGEVRFGVEPYEDPAKLEPAYRVLAGALEKKLDCPVSLQIVEDYSAEVLAMRNKRLDLGQFGPLGFVFASQRAGAEPVASFGTADGKPSTYTAGIWVKKDSPVHTLADLRGRSLALGSPGSTSGDALPRYALTRAGLKEGQVRTTYSGGHPESLLALTGGTVDAAQINSQTLATATKAGTFRPAEYRRIWTSEPIPNDPITVRGDAPPAFKKAVREALLQLSPKDVEKVAGFLDVTPPGPMVPVTKESYRPMFDLAKTMKLSEEDV